MPQALIMAPSGGHNFRQFIRDHYPESEIAKPLLLLLRSGRGVFVFGHITGLESKGEERRF